MSWRHVGCKCCATSCAACGQQDLTLTVSDVILNGFNHGNKTFANAFIFGCTNQCTVGRGQFDVLNALPGACTDMMSPHWWWHFNGFTGSANVHVELLISLLRSGPVTDCTGGVDTYMGQILMLIGTTGPPVSCLVNSICFDLGEINPCAPPDILRAVSGPICSASLDFGL